MINYSITITSENKNYLLPSELECSRFLVDLFFKIRLLKIKEQLLPCTLSDILHYIIIYKCILNDFVNTKSLYVELIF